MLQKEEKNLSPKQRLEKKKKTRVYKSYNTIVVVRAEGKTEDNFFKEFFGKTKNMPIAERNAVLNNIIPSIQLKPDEDEVILADIKNKKFSTIYAKE